MQAVAVLYVLDYEWIKRLHGGRRPVVGLSSSSSGGGRANHLIAEPSLPDHGANAAEILQTPILHGEKDEYIDVLHGNIYKRGTCWVAWMLRHQVTARWTCIVAFGTADEYILVGTWPWCNYRSWRAAAE